MQEDIALLVLPCGETIGLSEQRFRFSNTAHEFDDHIGKSIRGYHDLRDDIVGISRYFVEDDTTVVGIGCSEGSMIRRIRDANDQAPNLLDLHFIMETKPV